MLNGIQNFLQIINDNWTTIVVIISLILGIVQKVKSYFSKSKKEQVEITKSYISEIILKLIMDAEMNYENWNKAGSIKRAEVIDKIFTTYPILTKVSNQQEIIAWIDEMIDKSLKDLHGIIDNNAPQE